MIRRYWETLRHLRLVQLYGRARRWVARPRPNLAPPPPLGTHTGSWRDAARRKPSLVGPGQFVLLGLPGDLALIGWDGPEREKLWRYNQHYFDDLNAHDHGQRNAWHWHLIDNWISHNPPGLGTGWEPYPTALRIVNWVKWSLAGNSLSPAMQANLAIQARWLACNLETHLLGNHLLANAKALIFAGLYFTGEEAAEWRRTGERLLAIELKEQILADGGHFELSPMYHLIVLEDILDLVNLYGASAQDVAPQWTKTVDRMLPWARIMRHPDGEIPFFNDAAFDVAPRPAEIDAYAMRLGWGRKGEQVMRGYTFLAASGYGRMSAGSAQVFVDLAAIGPDHLPAHAHADTLSFEFSLGTERVIVNGGTSAYGHGLDRKQQRSTRSHATVVLDDTDSSEVWAGFRVGHRARVSEARMWQDSTAIFATGKHDGYRRLPGNPTHRRFWTLQRGGLRIDDDLEGSGSHQIEIVLPLAAELLPRLSPGGVIEILSRSRLVATVCFDHATNSEVHLEEIKWHPRFGLSLPSWRIRRQIWSNLPCRLVTHVTWAEVQ